MPRLLFVNRYFHPDHSATSQLLSDLAFHLAEVGFDVGILTSRQVYDDPQQVLASDENVRGVQVRRLWTTRFGRGRLLPRAVDYLSFYVGATLELLRRADADTVIIAKTDPPLLSVPSALVAWLRHASLVNWTQDLFPEIAQSLAVPGIGLVTPLLRRLRNLSLAMANHNVVLGDHMAAHLQGEGIAPEKISVIHNWSLSEVDAPCDEACQALRRQWGLEGKLVVGYSGNFGRAHDFSTAIAAARVLADRDDVRFLFIGDGAQRGWLEEQGRTLPNLVLRPYQPLERLPVTLSLPDVHLVSLKPELEGLVMPSKLYAVLSAGRPVFFIGSQQGEIARLLDVAGAGRCFAVGAGEALAAAVRELATEPALAKAMGQRARALWNERFKRSRAHATWRALLSSLTDRSP